jgi:hypothetical protein
MIIFRPGQGLMYGTSTGELNSVLPDCFEQVPSTATDSETSSDWPSLNNARTERISTKLTLFFQHRWTLKVTVVFF